MTDDPDLSCPPWCQQPTGHLHLDDGRGDYHTADVTTINFPEIPGLRGESSALVRIGQYVTRARTYEPVISLDVDDDGDAGSIESLTPDDAAALAAALHQAIATLTSTPTSPGDDGDSATRRAGPGLRPWAVDTDQPPADAGEGRVR